MHYYFTCCRHSSKQNKHPYSHVTSMLSAILCPLLVSFFINLIPVKLFIHMKLFPLKSELRIYPPTSKVSQLPLLLVN